LFSRCQLGLPTTSGHFAVWVLELRSPGWCRPLNVIFEVTENAEEKMSSPEPKTRLALQPKYQRQAPIVQRPMLAADQHKP